MRIIVKYTLSFALYVFLQGFPQVATAEKDKVNRRLPLVSVKLAELVETTEHINSIGRLVAANPTVISADVSQEVIGVYGRVGENVKKGQVLVMLNPLEIQRIIKGIKAELLLETTSRDLLKSQLILRKAKVNRARGLRDKKALSQDSYETTKILALQVEQQLVQREYNITKLELSLEQSFDDLRATKIVAPIQGNLIEIRVQKGAFVKKGQEIGSIFNQLASEVEINLRADLASNVIIGSKVKIKFGRSSYLGRLRGLVKVENTRTGTRVARITPVKPFPPSVGVLGARFMLEVPVGKKSPKLLVPKDALVPNGEEKNIFVFEEGIAKKRTVILGASIGSAIEIKKGVKPGEMVIIKGNEGIRSHQPVKIKNGLKK